MVTFYECNSYISIISYDFETELMCNHDTGVDVVSSVIDKNKVKFNDLEWMKFSSQDLSSWTENLPNGYDLILSRDALQHLSYSSIAGRSN